MKTFRDLINESKFALDRREVLKALKDDGYKDFKQNNGPKMDQYTNKVLIVSLSNGHVKGEDVYSVMRVRDYDISNGVACKPKSIKEFKDIISAENVKSIPT